MKKAVSISIGSSKRNKTVEIELLGEHISIERIGTDGDMEKAAQLFGELDGKVDAFGVGGADLGLLVEGKWYPIHSVQRLVRNIKQTPVVDGAGLKNTLEGKIAPFIDRRLGHLLKERKAFITMGSDRWGMTTSFVNAGYQCTFGDLMFTAGIPIPLHSLRSLKAVVAILAPVLTRLPFAWLYPIGEAQEKRVPKWESYYQASEVIAGDCHYVKRHMPDRLVGKIIATNTTTSADQELFRQAGVKALVTSTPLLDGRTFGTNMMEAALVAIAGKGRPLTLPELDTLLDQLGFEPQLQELN